MVECFGIRIKEMIYVHDLMKMRIHIQYNTFTD